jgi:hypothetical protein
MVASVHGGALAGATPRVMRSFPLAGEREPLNRGIMAVHGKPMEWAPPKAEDVMVASVILYATELLVPLTRRRYHVRLADRDGYSAESSSLRR